jgi:DNA repair exonuclease SbcCD ATPase subunit
MNNIQVYKTKISKCQGKLESLQSRKDKIVEDLDDLIVKQNALEEAQAFIQMIAQETQSQLRYSIADIVQLALDTCFPSEYVFDIDFKIERGRTSAQLIFKKDGIDLDPISASGGGVVDLAAFALRLSAWSLGHTDNVIILDEPFRFLSKELRSRAGEIMKKLSKSLGLQIIIVTHMDELIDNSDRIFEVTKVNNISKVCVKEN